MNRCRELLIERPASRVRAASCRLLWTRRRPRRSATAPSSRARALSTTQRTPRSTLWTSHPYKQCHPSNPCNPQVPSQLTHRHAARPPTLVLGLPSLRTSPTTLSMRSTSPQTATMPLPLPLYASCSAAASFLYIYPSTQDLQYIYSF